MAAKPISATLVLFGCISVVTAHLAALYTSGMSPWSTPVAALSQTTDGNLHGLGLSLFALAQVALVALIDGPGARWPTRLAQALLVINACLLIELAWHFASSPLDTNGTGLNYSLILLASSTGLIMSFAVPGLRRRHRSAGHWNVACLAAWLALGAMAFFVSSSWIGAYERIVGVVFVAWSSGLAILIGFSSPSGTGQAR